MGGGSGRKNERRSGIFLFLPLFTMIPNPCQDCTIHSSFSPSFCPRPPLFTIFSRNNLPLFQHCSTQYYHHHPLIFSMYAFRRILEYSSPLLLLFNSTGVLSNCSFPKDLYSHSLNVPIYSLN